MDELIDFLLEEIAVTGTNGKPAFSQLHLQAETPSLLRDQHCCYDARSIPFVVVLTLSEVLQADTIVS